MLLTLKNKGTEIFKPTVNIFAKKIDFNTIGVTISLNDEADVEILEKAGYRCSETKDRVLILLLTLWDFIQAINVIQNS